MFFLLILNPFQSMQMIINLSSITCILDTKSPNNYQVQGRYKEIKYDPTLLITLYCLLNLLKDKLFNIPIYWMMIILNILNINMHQIIKFLQLLSFNNYLMVKALNWFI